MALAAPAVIVAEYGQDLTVTVTLTTATDVSAWDATATLRAYAGGTALATKTIGSGITVTNSATGVFTVAFTAAELTQPPGSYIFEMDRTNPGYVFPIVDPSAFRIRYSASAAYPTLTNQAEYLSWIGASETVSDTDTKQQLIALSAAENLIRRLCGRQFTYASYTEYPVANWQRYFVLTETPVTAITSLFWDQSAAAGQNSNDFATATLLTLGDDYFLNRDRTTDTYSNTGFVYRIGGGVWEGWLERPVGYLAYQRVKALGKIKCVYTGGFSLVPDDIRVAVFDVASMMMEAGLTGRLGTSESGEGYSVGYGGIDQDAKRIGSVQNVVYSYRRGSLIVG